MKIIKHRHNFVPNFDMKFGLEIDVRDYNGILVLSHDLPNEKCLSFEKFLESIKIWNSYMFLMSQQILRLID